MVDLVRKQAAENEARVRWLLGFWVSEVEPSVALNSRGWVLGLTAPGGSKVLVWHPAASLSRWRG